MHRAAALLVFVFSQPCWAELVQYGESHASRSFVDTATLRVNGSVRQVWILQTLKAPDSSGARSYKIQMEYDCTNSSRFRSLQAYYFPSADASGNPSSSRLTVAPWNAVVPGSVGDTATRLVCSR